MMRQLLILAGVTAAMMLAQPASAQNPFADVPSKHWANGAVSVLASWGIVTGYPDGTFGGKRALNRYELAAAFQRVLQDQGHRLPAAQSAVPGNALTREEAERIIDDRLRNVPTRVEVDLLRGDVDQLRRLAEQIRETLTTLRIEVDQLKQEVGTLNGSPRR